MDKSAPAVRPIDENAARIPKRSGLPLCLYVPIAARDTFSIQKYVGRIATQLMPNSPSAALMVEAYEPEKADAARLAIWDVPEVTVLHMSRQVWVHVDYRAYRPAYLKAFPDFDLSGLVLDHVMNRRVARVKGFAYLLVVPISRGTNSSHGSLSEDWAVKYHGSPEMREKNRVSRAAVQYADLSDIVKMLNIQGGGSLMGNVNEAQKLVSLPIVTKSR
jgi:hypothetical protein